MDSKIKSMTEGSPIKLIVAFAIPLMLGNVFQQLYTVVDTIVVGNFLSVTGLAAIGAADWLYWGFFSLVQGFAQGFSILMAQHFGAKRIDDLRSDIAGSVILSIFISFSCLILGQIFALPILNLLKTPSDIIGMTLLYIRTIFFGIPINMAYNLAAAILRSLGDSKTPLSAMIVASITNIALDLLFVVVFKMGISGAAIATIIAQATSFVYCLYYLSKIDFIKLSKQDFSNSYLWLYKMFSLGAPMAFQNGIIAIGGMIVQSVVNGYGVAFIGGYTATNKLYGILEIAAVSFGYSMVTYAGQNLGAGNIDRIKKGVKSANILAVLTSLVISFLMIIFGKGILSLFLSGDSIEVQEALRYGYEFLFIMACSLSILYVLHVTRSTIQGMGNTFLPMVSGIVEFCMRIGSVMILPMFFEEHGVFFAETAAWLGADVILISAYFYLMKRFEKQKSMV